MSYTALYRKFRPREFEDVKGQDHIVTTLKNQIKADRVGHAYLFCGTRGTGKTTIAKIFAKAVNCEHPVDGSPCNECSMCKAINNQTSMNVIEIDAASNNGVDNVREIIDSVQYSPTEGKYKVYIIDEVHMLSAGAFNALLKTLEEPPSYVMFILATTEVHKIPITILSRCQRYDFRRITIDVIAARLMELMQREGIDVEEKALRYVAKAADGSMRDGLSLLDQCIAFYFGDTLTYDKVLDVLGAVDVEVYTRLLNFVLEQNVVGCIELLEELVINGRELGQFVVDFTWYLRNLMLIKTSDESIELVDVSTENRQVLQEIAVRVDLDTLMRYIRIFSELSNQVKYATQKRVLIEVACIKLCQPAMEENYDSLLDRMRILEQKMEQGIPMVAMNQQPNMQKKAVESKELSKEETEQLVAALPEEIKQVAANWGRIVSNIKGPIKTMVANATPTSRGDGNVLILVFQDELDRDYVNKTEHIEMIQDIIRSQINKDVVVQTKLVNQEGESLDKIPDLSKLINFTDIEYV